MYMLLLEITSHMQNSLGLLATPNVFLVNIQKACYHIKWFEQLFDSMWTNLAWWTIGPSNRFVVHIETNSWMLLHPMICCKPIAWNLMHIVVGHGPWQRVHNLLINSFFVKVFEGGDKILPQTFRDHSTMVIIVITKVWTMLRMCLITTCQ
jgi:hypothetical protein